MVKPIQNRQLNRSNPFVALVMALCRQVHGIQTTGTVPQEASLKQLLRCFVLQLTTCVQHLHNTFVAAAGHRKGHAFR